MSKFEVRVDALRQEMKDPLFCGTICTECGGGTQNCTAALILKIRDLEDKVLNLINTSNKLRQNLQKGCKKSTNTKSYIKLKKFSLDEILPLIGNAERKKLTEDITVKVCSVRLRTFKKSLVCVSCGLVGTHFWAEKKENDISPHLNLYAINKDGHEVLMTRDHIIPKSKGGPDNLHNMQTMCCKCNSKKGNTL